MCYLCVCVCVCVCIFSTILQTDSWQTYLKESISLRSIESYQLFFPLKILFKLLIASKNESDGRIKLRIQLFCAQSTIALHP